VVNTPSAIPMDPGASPQPLQTEEDFLRLFKAEIVAANAVPMEAPAPSVVPVVAVAMETAEDFLRQFHVDQPVMAEPEAIPP